MRAVDTNVLVRLLTRDDPKQTAEAEAFVAPGAWVPNIVLVEAMWVLASVYGREPPAIATAIEMLLDHRDLTIEDGVVVAAAVEQYRTTPRVGFSDCLVLQMARKTGHLPLGTFDKDLARLEGVHRI